MALPMEGIKVLDLGTQLPGKHCTGLLGDLGAEVIRIERPLPPGEAPPPLTGEDLGLNRNKRSITLNLRSEAGREVFYRLASNADVIVEGNRPGVVKRLGIDYETLKKLNPRLVYCSISSFGQDGPYSQVPAFDIVNVAMAGLMTLGLEPEAPPQVPGLFAADIGGAMFGTIGILVALYAREKTGRGQLVDVSMVDGLVSWLTGIYGTDYLSRGRRPRAFSHPAYDLYQAGDGKYLALGVSRPQSWQALCQALGREDLGPYQMPAPEKMEEIRSAFRLAFKNKTRKEWIDLLRPLDVEIGPVNTLEEVFSDPQVLHRQMVVEVEDPARGKARQIGLPVKLSETPGRIRSLAPQVGQDTEEVLIGLGYTRQDIARLRQASAI